MSLTGLGIALGSLGSVAINTGNNVQSLGMAQLEARVHAEELLEADDGRRGIEATEKKPARNSDGEIDSCQSKTWIVGTIIFISGSLLNFAAFAFAPQSILASLEGIQFVTNVLFGKLVLGKVITRCMWAGTAVTILGVVLTVLSASVVGTLEASFQDLQALWGEPAWLIYLSLTVTLGVVLQTTHQLYLKANVAGAALPYAEYVLPATYATFSALFGTLSVVQAKILSELLTLQIEKGTPIFWGENAWFTYVTLGAWLFLVGVWLFRMNEALSLYDPLFIIPLLQMNFILFAIVSGGIYFKEFNEFGTLNWLGFIAGVCLLFLGIYLLSPNALATGEGTTPGISGDGSDVGNSCAVATSLGFGSLARIVPLDEEEGVPTTPRHREAGAQVTPAGNEHCPSSSHTTPRSVSVDSQGRRGSGEGRGYSTSVDRGESERSGGAFKRPQQSAAATAVSRRFSPSTGTANTSTLPFYNLIPPSMRAHVREHGDGDDPNHPVHQEAMLLDSMRQVALDLAQIGGSFTQGGSFAHMSSLPSIQNTTPTTDRSQPPAENEVVVVTQQPDLESQPEEGVFVVSPFQLSVPSIQNPTPTTERSQPPAENEVVVTPQPDLESQSEMEAKKLAEEPQNPKEEEEEAPPRAGVTRIEGIGC